jgi:hypothetical protein
VVFLPADLAQITCTATPAPAPPAVSPCLTIEEAILRLPASERWALHQTTHIDNGASLAAAIIRRNATAVSDGSYKDQLGTSATILRSPGDRSAAILSVNRVPGLPSDQSAYRSELAGVLASLLMVEIVCQLHDITDGAIKLGLDGEQAMKDAGDDWPLHCTHAQYDILRAIRSVRTRLPVNVLWQWIPSHQDKLHSFRSLDPLAQDNVLVDNYAKAFLNFQVVTGWIPSPIRLQEGWSCMVDGTKLASLDVNSLYAHLWSDKTRRYWSKKFDWSPSTIETIDFDILGQCFGPLPFSKQRKTVKLANGQLAVGRQMQRYRFQEHDNCPRCDGPDETNIHVLLCPAPSARSTAKSSILGLKVWMEKNDTHPAIVSSVIAGVSSCLRGRPPPPTSWRVARRACAAQSTIGWRPLLYGFAAKHWQILQRHHLLAIRSRKSSRRWTIAWLRQLMQVAWDQWDHRNYILHNTQTPAKLREQAVLDGFIADQFTAGLSTLLPADRHWLTRHSALHIVTTYSNESKQQWLESLDISRLRASSQSTVAQSSSLTRQRDLLQTWLLPVTAP